MNAETNFIAVVSQLRMPAYGTKQTNSMTRATSAPDPKQTSWAQRVRASQINNPREALELASLGARG